MIYFWSITIFYRVSFTNPFYNLIFVFYGCSFFFLTLVLKHIEVSVAYAVWSGLGTALIAAIGILYFKESITFVKLVSLLLIVLGVVGLNLSSVASNK